MVHHHRKGLPIQLQQIPALTAASPDHRSVVFMPRSPIAVGCCFCVGHHRVDLDVWRAPTPAPSDWSRFCAKAFALLWCWRLRPGTRDTTHARAREGYSIGIALPGVCWQIHAVGVKTVNPTIASNDRVVTTRTNPVVASSSPMHINPCSHADDVPSVQRWQGGTYRQTFCINAEHKLPTTNAQSLKFEHYSTMRVDRYKRKDGDRRSFAQRHRAADKRERASGLRNRSFFWTLTRTWVGIRAQPFALEMASSAVNRKRADLVQALRSPSKDPTIVRQKKTPPKAGFLDFLLGVLPCFHSVKKSSSHVHSVRRTGKMPVCANTCLTVTYFLPGKA